MDGFMACPEVRSRATSATLSKHQSVSNHGQHLQPYEGPQMNVVELDLIELGWVYFTFAKDLREPVTRNAHHRHPRAFRIYL